VLPPEVRPDFSSMLGGVRLEGVHLTLRSKTDRLVLSDASLEVAAGHAAIITGGCCLERDASTASGCTPACRSQACERGPYCAFGSKQR